MPSFQSCAAILALVAASAASPVNLLDKRSTFTVNQVPSSKNTTKLPGPVAVQKALLKYRAAVPANVAAAAAAAVTGSVTATPEENDVEYLEQVTVGSTVLELDFDTGSADLWVFSTLLPSSESSGHTLYNPSSGTRESGETFDITYGDNSGASGVVYSDKVVVGGVTATSQAVEAATSVSSQFVEDTDSDGLLGLAFSSINTVSPTPANTFFDNVKANLASPLFTADLKKGAPGSYDFGFIDSSKYTGSITYVDVDDSQGFWGFTASAYKIGSGTTHTTSIPAIVDTGTTLWFLPTSVVEAYWGSVSGASYSNSEGGYVFPCSATLPSLSTTIGGTSFTVPGSYLNYATVSGSTCFGGVQENTGIGFSIFGDIFIKDKFIVFENSGSPQLGFANQS